MEFMNKFITILKIKQDDVSLILFNCIGKSKSEIQDFLINEIYQRILIQYDNVKYNFDIILFEDKHILLRKPTRSSILNQLIHIDFLSQDYDIKNFILDITIKYPNEQEFIWSIVSQLKIPAMYLRMACLFLIKFNSCLIEEVLKKILFSKCIVVE